MRSCLPVLLSISASCWFALLTRSGLKKPALSTTWALAATAGPAETQSDAAAAMIRMKLLDFHMTESPRPLLVQRLCQPLNSDPPPVLRNRLQVHVDSLAVRGQQVFYPARPLHHDNAVLIRQ